MNEDQKFLTELRLGPIGEKIRQDAEAARHKRRREAIECQAALAKSEPQFIEKFRAAGAEVEAKRGKVDKAEAALMEARAELLSASFSRDEMLKAREGLEDQARAAVARDSNPNRWTLLFRPIDDEIERTRHVKPRNDIETKPGYVSRGSGGNILVKHESSAPSITARMAFLQRAPELLQKFLLTVDDDDATLIKLRENLLKAAPVAELLIEIPLEFHGIRIANDRASEAARAAAEKFAAEGFGLGVAAIEEPSAVVTDEELGATVVPIKRGAGK